MLKSRHVAVPCMAFQITKSPFHTLEKLCTKIASVGRWKHQATSTTKILLYSLRQHPSSFGLVFHILPSFQVAVCHHFVKKKASEFYHCKTSNILLPEFLSNCGEVMEHFFKSAFTKTKKYIKMFCFLLTIMINFKYLMKILILK